jgi:large subunit ribosomal protein L25
MEKAAVNRLLRLQHKGSQVILDIEGQKYNTLIKDVEYNPNAGRVDEIDFQALVNNEKVHSVAEINVANHDMVLGGVIQENLSEISYKAFPSALVERITIDASKLKVGDTVRVKDLEIAQNPEIDLITDPEAVVVTVAVVHNAEPETENEE